MHNYSKYFEVSFLYAAVIFEMLPLTYKTIDFTISKGSSIEGFDKKICADILSFFVLFFLI